MIGNNKTRWAGLAAAALLLSGTVGFGSSEAGAAGAADPADFVATLPVGSLALQLRTDANGVVSGKVLQYDNAAALIDTQTFSISRCEVTTDGHLLQFVSSSGRVGIYNNGLGTKTKGNCTPAEGRTETGESFTVKLGSKFGAGISIDGAELDIEGKFSAVLQWSAKNGATPVVVGTGSAPLSTSNDNGPDAGTGDNSIVTIGAKGTSTDNYTSLVLTTPTGEFGLDGGGDGVYPVHNSLGNNDSIFSLVSSSTFDYTVDCATTLSADSTDIGASDTTSVLDSTVDSVTYVRLANKNQADCATIGVTVRASDVNPNAAPDEVFIDNSTTSAGGVPQNVRARAKIVWVVQTAGKTQAQIDAELAREVQFVEGGAKVPVSNCTNVPASVWGEPFGALNPDSTAVITHPAGFPWCLMSDSRVVTNGTIVQTQYYSGNGDPRFA